MKFETTTQRWRSLTLPRQFLLAGAAVMVAATLIVENWVSNRIADSVVQNSAISAALYMESFVSPLSQELAETDTLSPPARQALAEVFENTPLAERIVSYKIWIAGGQIVHGSDPALIGQVFPLSEDQHQAWAGEIAASFEDLDELENANEAALGVPLLEVYFPIRQAWTGEVIAVAEFYENAAALDQDIANAHRTSWFVVGGTFLASGLLLFGIVQAGGRTIRDQQRTLRAQLETTKQISAQNAELRNRVVAASARATAQTERAIRRIGSDLHDGPAQYLSLASLRLDSALGDQAQPQGDAALVRGSLDKALDELRMISRGLALPDLDGLSLADLIARAVKDHQRQTQLSVTTQVQTAADLTLNYAQKLCVFRFLQETLSNVSRHARTSLATITSHSDGQALHIIVADQGAGFDATAPRALRNDGGQGLFGLTDRAESIGGGLAIRSNPGRGTTLTLTLPLEEGTA